MRSQTFPWHLVCGKLFPVIRLLHTSLGFLLESKLIKIVGPLNARIAQHIDLIHQAYWLCNCCWYVKGLLRSPLILSVTCVCMHMCVARSLLAFTRVKSFSVTLYCTVPYRRGSDIRSLCLSGQTVFIFQENMTLWKLQNCTMCQIRKLVLITDDVNCYCGPVCIAFHSCFMKYRLCK